VAKIEPLHLLEQFPALLNPGKHSLALIGQPHEPPLEQADLTLGRPTHLRTGYGAE
jgi:hypothetical protein